MEIRRYQPADHEEVWALHVLGLLHAGTYTGDGPWDNDLHAIEDIYIRKNGEFLVGLLNNRIVAMGAFQQITQEQAEIKRMRVHPDYQRRGLGLLILQALEKRALETGYSVLFLDTPSVQIAAHRLYRKHGFHETGKTRINRGFLKIFFEKTIR